MFNLASLAIRLMKKIRMLLVEDDSDDVQLLQEAMRENNVDFEMKVIMEGDKVMPYLNTAENLPDIIVMDFNLPKIHGKEVLVSIRATAAFSSIPLIVLTTSASPHDIQFAQQNGADKFITKPSTIHGFNSAVQTIVAMTETH
jgi:DNA-binding response OmpR family regulator